MGMMTCVIQKVSEAVSNNTLFETFFETAAGNSSSVFFYLVLQNRESRWKNRAIKSQARVHMALRDMPLSTLEFSLYPELDRSLYRSFVKVELTCRATFSCSTVIVLSFFICLTGLVSLELYTSLREIR